MNPTHNPLKILKTVNQFTKVAKPDNESDDSKLYLISDFQFVVELYPSYFNLGEGVWNVGLSQAIIRNIGAKFAKTAFNAKTSLVTQFVKNPYKLTESATTQYVTLNTITLGDGDMKKNAFYIDVFNPILWFQVEKGNSTSFVLEYSEVTSNNFTNENLAYELEIESTFLFQRIR